jgi:hypothetical protein
MNKIETLWLALRFSAAAALLASCGEGAGLQGPSFPETAGTNLGVGPPVAIHPDTRKSWISPDANRAPRLFFASDLVTDDVDIFTLPDFVLKGTITGFSEPQGMCTGLAGTVWVANTGTTQVMQLSRTGKLLNTIDDASGYPVSCAVNPANGDLAVLNIFGFYGAGDALVYTCPSCTPTELTIPKFYDYYFGGYDTKGNLFLDGRNSSGSTVVGEVSAGRTAGHVIAISGGTIYFPGSVQWYQPGNYLLLGDQLCNGSNSGCLYWVSISKSKGTITGQTDLLSPSGQNCGAAQVELDPVNDKNVVGGSSCGSAFILGRWLYPAGGTPTNYLSFGYALAGGAISVK